jgi:hypothetical protein
MGFSENEANLIVSIAQLGIPSVTVGTIKTAVNNARINNYINANMDNWIKAATKNADSNIVLLGKYEGHLPTSYTEVAKLKKATYFEFGQADWSDIAKVIGEDRMWKINERFLDAQIDAGKTFVFSHNPLEATGIFAREIKYITQNKGYQLVMEGGDWIAKKK